LVIGLFRSATFPGTKLQLFRVPSASSEQELSEPAAVAVAPVRLAAVKTY
jgi:hypothetical protein